MHKRKQNASNYRCKSKHWCFTLNNPKDGELVWLPNQMTYLIAGRERAPETGTIHLQGYVCFRTRKRLPGVKKIYPRAHIEQCEGTPQQNITYCSKDGDFVTYGTEPQTAQQVSKTNMQAKWDLAYDLAIQGRIKEIPKGMQVRYYHAWKRIYQDQPQDVADLDKKDNYWIVAPSGFGKSTYARKRWPDFYDKPPNKWWTGYKGQPTILCDDFGPQQCQYIGWYMKRWGDKFTFPIETKGGGCAAIRPERIVLTSQYDIHDCFEDQLVVEAIQNRFQVIRLKSWQERRADRAILRAQERLNFRNPTSQEARDEETQDNADLITASTATTIEISDDEIDLTQLYGYTAPE